MYRSKDSIAITILALVKISSYSTHAQGFVNHWFDETSPATLISSDNYPSYLLFDHTKMNASLHDFTKDRFHTCQNIKIFNNTPSGYASFQLTTMSNGLNVLIVDTLSEAQISSNLLIINSTDCQIQNETIYDAISPEEYGFSLMTSCGDLVELFFIENGTSSFKEYNVTSRKWHMPVTFPILNTIEDKIDLVSQVVKSVYLIASGDFANRTLSTYNLTSNITTSLSFREGYYTSFLSKYLSTSNNAIGYCYAMNISCIRCMRLEPNLKIMLSVEVPLDFDPLFIGVHNGRDGDLVLLVGHISGGVISLFKIRRDSTHEARGQVAVIDCLPFNEHFFTFFERPAGNVCVRFLCSRRVERRITKSVFVKCFGNLMHV